MDIILASKSPRRRELMKKITSSFLIEIEDIDEDKSYNLDPVHAVRDIALRKNEVIRNNHINDVVISADTIVVLNNKIIGKPIDEKDAYRILKELSNKTHQVITGYCISYQNKQIINHVISEVKFNKLDDELINKYIKSGSPLDKAGAYGIQDNNQYPIIKEYQGSLDNIVGFPVKEIEIDLKRIISDN